MEPLSQKDYFALLRVKNKRKKTFIGPRQMKRRVDAAMAEVRIRRILITEEPEYSSEEGNSSSIGVDDSDRTRLDNLTAASSYSQPFDTQQSIMDDHFSDNCCTSSLSKSCIENNLNDSLETDIFAVM